MKIVTWNINSVRLRAPLIVDMMGLLKPDVICLQETKCQDDLFPSQTFKDAGYTYIHMAGQKAYNGVAILSKFPIQNRMIYKRAELHDARHISAEIKGIVVHNIYVPAGGEIPNVDHNPKFAHKLKFMDDLIQFFGLNRAPTIMVGDMNIAPLEHDVWSHKQLLDVVSHTPIEVEKMDALMEKGNFMDAIRHFVPESEKCYSWWSYRNQDWQKSNRGRRLDHIWMTKDLKDRLKSYHIETEARNAEKPSDHVPIMVEIR